MRMLRHLFSACACLAAAAPLRADFRALWPLDGSLAAVNGSAPERSVEDNLKSSGGRLQLHFDPVLGWTQSRWLILPSLALDWNSANSIIKVQDDRFEFLQQADSRVELGTAFRRTPDQRFGVRLFSEAFQGKQAANEQITTGVYNYQDGGLSADWRQKWATDTPFRSTLGLTLTDRQYPNWVSLDPSHLKEKDQSITKLYTDLEWAWTSAPASTVLSASIQRANYKEGLTIDSDGTTLAGTKLYDQVVDLGLTVPFQFGRHGLSLELAGESWDSNLNIFDTQTGTYLADYNDFALARAALGYVYDFEGPWGFLESPQFTLDLSWEIRQYAKRPPRNEDGTLQDGVERDAVRDIAVGFNSAYTEHWAAFVKVDLQRAASNNYDRSTALYNYAFNTFSLGLNFVY